MEKYYSIKSRIELIKVLSGLSLLIMFSSTPFIIHYFFGGSYFLLSGLLTFFLFAVVLIYKINQECLKWILIWIVFFVLYFILSIYQTFIQNVGLYEIRKAVGFFVKILFVIGSTIIISKNFQKYLKYLFKTHTFLIIIGVLSIIIIVTGFFKDSFIIFTKNDGRDHYFWLVSASNSFFQYGRIKIFRLACFADEPGALALIITWLLILNEFTFKSKKLRIVLSLGGVFTLSLAFFISYFFLILYWLNIFRIKVKYIVGSFFTIVPIVLFIFFTKHPYITEPRDHLLNRLTLTSDNNGVSLAGDNRGIIKSFSSPLLKENIIFGIGKKKAFELAPENNIGIASAAGYMLMNGIYGYLFFYLPFFYLFWHFRKDKRVFLLLVIGLNFLQRPNIESMDAMVYLTLIYFSKFNNNLVYE